MTKFVVAFDSAHRNAIILNDGDENIPAGFEVIGNFDAPIDPETNRLTEGTASIQAENGDHIFIAEAKKLLEKEAGVTDFENLNIEDRASNQPQPDENVLTVKEMEQHNAAELRGTEENGSPDGSVEDGELTRAGKPAEAVVDEEAKTPAKRGSKPKK